MSLHGFGGTDFRPVFAHVEQLIDHHELLSLKGLIYFTDGFGTFPEKRPPYETAFVFLDNGVETPNVPPWAIKLVLDAEEMEEF
jgi:predicted metal-dependent peptidase